MKNVFEAHPDVDRIYVVDGMPFLKEGEAESHERTTGKKMEVIYKKDDELTPAGKAFFAAAAKIDAGAPKGKGKEAKGKDASDEGKDASDKGKDASDEGKDASDKGKDASDKGKDASDKGKGK